MAVDNVEEHKAELTPEELERFVTELKTCFNKLRALDGLRSVDTIKHDKLWTQLAKQLYASGISGRRYLYWAYNQYRRFSPIVYVPQLTSQKAVAWYQRDVLDYTAEITLLVHLQLQTLKNALDLGKTPREIIEDPALELGVVFKYALARSAGLPDLVDKLKPAAEAELYFEPGYETLLTKLPIAKRSGDAV
jgi:hypothetical protein